MTKHMPEGLASRRLLRWLGGLLLCGSSVGACADLTLGQATERLLASNPTLRMLTLNSETESARITSADQSAPYQLSIAAEKLTGSGDLSGGQQAELTLALSSSLQLGRRAAQVNVAEQRWQLQQARQTAEALTLVSQMTQTFVLTLALQQRLAVLANAEALALGTVSILNQQRNSGALNNASHWQAEVALQQLAQQHESLQAQLDIHRVELAAFWHQPQLEENLAGALLVQPSADDFELLFQRLSQHPALAVLASEQRLAEAEWQLSRNRSQTDIDWQLGLTQLQESGELAVNAAVSVPLFTEARQYGDVRAAQLQREVVQQRQIIERSELRSRLYRAWREYRSAQHRQQRLQQQILPQLEKILADTEQGYRLGRYRYRDWADAQQALLDAQLSLIDIATSARLNQLFIEQITAAPLSSQNSQGTQP